MGSCEREVLVEDRYVFRTRVKRGGGDDGDPYNFLSTLEAKVRTAAGEVVATLTGEILHQGECEEAGEDPVDAADTSAVLANVWQTAIDHEPDPWTVVHLEELWVAPAHRGRGLGLKLLYRTLSLRRFDAAVFVMEPMPLQHSPDRSAEEIRSRGLDLFEVCTASEGRAKLARYYAQVGFRWAKTGNSRDWMVLHRPKLRLPERPHEHAEIRG